MNKDSKELWYAVEKDTVFQRLNSSESGLEEREVRKRLKLFGPNTLQLKTSETIPRIILRQLHNPIEYILIFSALLALFLGKFADSLVIFSVVILNALIGFVQEYRAHKTIKALMLMVPQQTTVIREGDTKIVPSSQIVPGDVVVLQAGDRVSADLRLFSIKNLQCDESTLTGESFPVNKRIESSPEDALIPERKCMAFNGTYVTSGVGLGIVVATGLKTEFGKVSQLIEQVTVLETPLSIAIRRIARWIGLGVLAVSFGLFLIGYMRGSTLFDAGLAGITLAVAAIPEGLPAIITIASSIGVRRMARRQAIIRQLPAVEALGSTSIICTDKTGTLTYNEMTVQRIWTKSGFCFVSGVGYSLAEQLIPQDSINQEEITELLKGAILCSDATLDEHSKGWLPVGDPTEIALVVAGRKFGLREDKLREAWKRNDVIPFESERRMMATLNDSPSHQQYIFIKGAPEEVLACCKDAIDVDQFNQHIQAMAKDGMRVLAIAKKEVQPSTSQMDEKDIKSGCTLLGLVGMIDPPRKEVYQALKSCYEAGITVKMVTGDHPLTAEAIGRDLGILSKGKVISGSEMNLFNDDMWKKAANDNHVFARVSPNHKLKLVEILQEAGHVVAMTGDGVNDAAALKRADIGIAMGVKGTAVAKEASDMILADDNFASIEAAVEEGRRVYDNLIKSLAFVLPTSLGQALVILFSVLFFPIRTGILLHPIAPVQILWINLIVAVALSLPLAFESAESDTMRRPPRKKNAPVLSGFLIVKTLIVSAIMAIGTIGLFLWEYHTEIGKGTLEKMAISEAQTMAVTAMMFFQVFYLFSCRSIRDLTVKTNFFSNPFIFVGVSIVLIAQIAFVYSPFMNRLFGSSSLNLEAWLVSALVTFSMIPIIAFQKLIRKKIFRD
ncbi:MAG: HAD-IC family P-type ATPase [Chlamydiales bacterium]|nr:HAD-IC family P-type ATPase [Chlamydiales bacterium]